MYIVNPAVIPKGKKHPCNKRVADFLIYKKQLPLLARVGEVWYFAKTEALEEALKALPFWLKLVEKGGSHIDRKT